MKRKIKIANRIIITSLIYWVVYNTYFGWNELPESDLERWFDIVYVLSFYTALIYYLTPLHLMYMMVINVFDEKLEEMKVDRIQREKEFNAFKDKLDNMAKESEL